MSETPLQGLIEVAQYGDSDVIVTGKTVTARFWPWLLDKSP